MKNKVKIYTIIIIVFSILCGIITKDYILGTTILISGLLNIYYASIGKIENYIFGAIYCIIGAYIYYINGLYGLAILSIFLHFPLQIKGYLDWKKNMDKNNVVLVRGFTLKKTIIVVTSCLVGSLLLGYLLTKIPRQQLAFLDSSSNIVILCSIILMNLRYKEFWLVYIFANSIDVTIWIFNVIRHSPNSIMMLIVQIGYLVINFYGLISWYKLERRSK